MKQGKQNLILLVLLAAAVLCCAGLWATRPAEETAADPDLLVTDIPVGQVQALVLHNESGAIGLWNMADGVQVEGADAKDYAQSKLKTLIYKMAHLTAAKEVDAQLGELEKYGLDAPAAQASLLLQDATVRLQLGRANPISGEYYLKNETDDRVFLVDSFTAGLMLQSVQDLRDLSLWPDLLAEGADGLLERITIRSGGEQVVLQKLKSGGKDTGRFGMVEPVVTALDWENVLMKVTNPLKELVPTVFVSDTAPLADYGLDDPQIELELEFDGRSYKCVFARKDPDNWYCADPDTGLICQVPADAVAFLQIDFMDLVGDSIYTKAMADISRISMRWPEGSFVMEVEGESTWLTAQVGDRQLDHEQVLDFYNKIDSIPAAGVLEGDEEFAAKPALTISVALRNGGEDILEFCPLSDRQCAVCVNGVAGFTTYNTVVADLIAAAGTV